jgi:putative DNA methylase
VLATFTELVTEAHARVFTDSRNEQYADAITTYLAFALSRIIGTLTNLATWNSALSKESVTGAFRLQSLSMTWDFGESNPLLPGQPTEFGTSSRWVAEAVESVPTGKGSAAQADARAVSYESGLVATDPPYYDNVGYADLADFFYVWLRRSLSAVYPELMGTVLTPKTDELVADPVRHENAQEFFEKGFRAVFKQIRDSTTPDYPISVFYAFKQSEADDHGESSTGWQTLLDGMIQSGWQVTGTWPMRTERAGRSRHIESNALASSIVLACHPRPHNAATTDRRGFLALLREELPWRLKELQQGNIAPVDLAQAAIGPGMAVFSRHWQITEPDGSAMRVRTALQLINQVLDEVLAEQEGDFDTDSRWCVKWFEQMEWTAGEYGRAETLATALNTSIPGLERAGVLRARAGKVQLRRLEDLPDSYDPAKDDRPTMWEAVLHLSKRLEEDGPEASGQLMRQLQDVMDLNTVKELAYLLYSICDRKRRQDSALVFNNLVTSWPEIADAAQNAPVVTDYQATMDFTEE